MQFYNFDRYYINKGIKLTNECIYDKRIDTIIDLNEYSYDIIKCIFRFNKISLVLDNCNVEKNVLKEHLQFLYYNDILSIKRLFAKKSFYTTNIPKLILKASILFYLRTSLFIFFIQWIFNISFGESISYWNKFILTALFHEIGHVCTYYILNKGKVDIYININKFDFEVVTPLRSDINMKLVAVMGPIMGIITAIILIFIFQEKFIMLFIIFHLLLLTPFFKDGKEIWNNFN